MAKLMDALVKREGKEGIWLERMPIPSPSVGEVLIKISHAAICGTDIHIFNWDHWAQKNVPLGTIIGHEYCGTVVQIGENVRNVQVGALASGEGHLTCNGCRNCLTGRWHLCENTKGVGVHRHGAFAEYLCIPASNVWPVDDDFSRDILTIFDPLGNAVHTALSFELAGEDVLITGAGPIGMMATAIARFAGARRVVVTDINDYRLGLALKMGATRAVNVAKEDLRSVMKEIKIREGFDVALEMSGNAAAFNQLISVVRHGAKIALLGILPPETQVDWDKIVFNGLTIKGIYGREMYETWYKMTHMIQGGLDISAIITHRFDYRDFARGFAAMKSGESGKVILQWEKA